MKFLPLPNKDNPWYGIIFIIFLGLFLLSLAIISILFGVSFLGAGFPDRIYFKDSPILFILDTIITLLGAFYCLFYGIGSSYLKIRNKE